MSPRHVFLASLTLLSLLLGGCLNRELKPVLPCTVSRVSESVKINAVDKIDLLMVVDDSPSMKDEQEKLRRELPRLVQALASGDLEVGQPAGTPGLGELDFPVLKSLRVGVITPNLGTPPHRISNCEGSGDDGELVSTISADSAPGCSDWSSLFIELNPQDATPAEQLDFGFEAGCVATTGQDGCGYEQQLEALLKSVLPSSSAISPPFSTTQGKGDLNNFVRQDSLLVVLMVTDEEDCSTPNGEVFDTDSRNLQVSLPAEFTGQKTNNYRCAAFESELFSVSRYVDELLALREDPGNLVFAAITGVPIVDRDECEQSSDDPRCTGSNFDEILASPDMQYTPVINAEFGDVELESACVSQDGNQNAAPARRIVEVARGLAQGNEVGEAGVTVQSICADSFAPALNQVLEIVKSKLDVCLPRSLNPNASGFVTCEVIETLPEGKSCDIERGREFVDTVLGRDRCRIQQLQVPTNREAAEALSCENGACGWYYDDVTAAAQECAQKSFPQLLSFSQGAKPIAGAVFRLECLQSVQDSVVGVADVGGPCTAGSTCDGSLDHCARKLTCDPQLLEWREACQADSDCSFGAICDAVCPCLSSDTDCIETTCDGLVRKQPVCVNPTCTQ